MAPGDPSKERTKVAVLGGGAAGLTAAFELTRPEHGGRFEVTVYQLGWRLGGKGASGRNMGPGQGARIEEHGLHLWFGFYRNAFRLMRDVYAELRRPSHAPLATIDQAFTACDQVVAWDLIGTDWHSHTVCFPRFAPDPWNWKDDERLPTFWAVAERAVADVLRLAFFQTEDVGETEGLLRKAEELAREQAQTEGLAGWALAKFKDLVQRARDRFREQWESQLAINPRVRIIYTTLDAFAALMVGIIHDVLRDPRGFDAVDDQEWTAWLTCHGLCDLTIGEDFQHRAPALRGVYDVAFGFPRGRVECANVAAGTATNDLLLLLFTYRGAILYKMNAGMGDAIFAPLYEVLRCRGVDFRFFHAVTELGLSADRALVETIEVVPQAHVPGGVYDPLVPVKGLPCWPSQPLWNQLEKAAEACGTKFETELNPLKKPGEVLKRREDFDEVVLAIPVGALECICDPLMKKSERFRKMVRCSATVRTQAFQLWTTEPREKLGDPRKTDAVASTYVEPLDTYCDMGHLLDVECWKDGDGAKGIFYVCGVLEDGPGETSSAPADTVKDNVRGYLRNDIKRIWSRAADNRPGNPFRWSVLFDPRKRLGEGRLEAQYWRANVAPWERYVITPAGSVRYRLRSDESGFPNLVLAGDWTKNGINGGCVEAAVVSGMQAARDTVRRTGPIEGPTEPIVGEDPTWLTP
jgi:uncharacterized protein with NAD-binding domain and iron-sulfur cluster